MGRMTAVKISVLINLINEIHPVSIKIVSGYLMTLTN